MASVVRPLRLFGRRGLCSAKLTHVGEDGRAKMVDVSDKPQCELARAVRCARARARASRL